MKFECNYTTTLTSTSALALHQHMHYECTCNKRYPGDFPRKVGKGVAVVTSPPSHTRASTSPHRLSRPEECSDRYRSWLGYGRNSSLDTRPATSPHRLRGVRAGKAREQLPLPTLLFARECWDTYRDSHRFSPISSRLSWEVPGNHHWRSWSALVLVLEY